MQLLAVKHRTTSPIDKFFWKNMNLNWMKKWTGENKNLKKKMISFKKNQEWPTTCSIPMLRASVLMQKSTVFILLQNSGKVLPTAQWDIVCI